MDEVFNEAAPPRKPVGNTVMGQPEALFRQAWISTLSEAMLKTGKGFRMDSPKRSPKKGAAGWRGERRADKAETSKLERRLLTAVV
jgi:hypothetical protein